MRTTRTATERRPGRALPGRGYVFAFAAAIAYAASQVIAREGVKELDAPLVGTTIALIFASVAFIPLALRSRATPVTDFRRGALFFAGAGIFSAVGVASMFLAIERAEVVVVSPVSSTHPLFTLLLAAVLLRNIERITMGIVVGGLLTFAGIVLITVS
jgi:DME family drug/metabolite transporter